MTIKYETIKKDNMLIVKLWSTNCFSVDSQISVVQTIKDEDFKKAGNLIDRSSMPFRICYLIVKTFNEKLCAGLARYSEYIFDDDVRTSLATYIQAINNGSVEIVPETTFKKMLDEVEEYSKSLM